MTYEFYPKPLSDALAELIQQRGYARAGSDRQLKEAWSKAVPEELRSFTNPLKVTRGVLQVGVTNPVALSELASFHKAGIVAKLMSDAGHLRIRDIKFKLDS